MVIERNLFIFILWYIRVKLKKEEEIIMKKVLVGMVLVFILVVGVVLVGISVVIGDFLILGFFS